MSVNLRAIYAFAREMYSKNSTDHLQYGTAGFRGKAEVLNSVMFRMGVLATLRSRVCGGAVIGVMVTASHNPEPDNGVKVIDPKGEMLAASWESIATDLVNVPDLELEQKVAEIICQNNIDIGSSSYVFVGMDNRYHSPGLLKAVCDGVIALKGNVREFGIVTTPMMHFFVVAANTKGVYGQPTEEGYYKKLISAFEDIRACRGDVGNYKNHVLFDGANGVGARKMLRFLQRMNNSLNVEVFNKGDGKINQDCGAEHVKLHQRLPVGMPDIKPYARCVTVDGDADRILYFFTDNNGELHLLDGDRIATLFADYLKDLVIICSLDLSIGLVQTAYANGASTDYIRNALKVPVFCVSTGVKHLHQKALEFDIGIYFEANGHGTVHFSSSAKKIIADKADSNADAKTFLRVIDMINETVGDAISDMLLVETILHSKGWDVKEWEATYTDLPNLQLKVKVADRNVITTTNADTICTAPIGLQEEINKVVAIYNRGRSFVRPSGTEDIVRVYAEAATKEDAENLAHNVAALVHSMAGGIGSENGVAMRKNNSHI